MARIPTTTLASALALAACGGSDGDTPRADREVAAQLAAACGAADVASLKSLVYVSPQGNDVAGCGKTNAAACQSIQQGIEQCGAAGCGVLVRHRRYATAATIHMRDAVNVVGSCRFDGEANHRYRIVIDAAPHPAHRR